MRKVTMYTCGGIILISMLFTLCTSKPHSGAFFNVPNGITDTGEALDSIKLEAQTALAECESSFNAAYMEAMSEAKSSRRTIIRATQRPYIYQNDTLSIQTLKLKQHE